jgi:integrase
MAARSEGQVVVRHWKVGRGFALRFIAYGERQYVTLGLEIEGWTRKRATQELANVLADVRRGIWTPPQRGSGRRGNDSSKPDGVPTFGSFALGLIASRKDQVSEKIYEYLDWGLAHLLPYFADWPLSESM